MYVYFAKLKKDLQLFRMKNLKRSLLYLLFFEEKIVVGTQTFSNFIN